MTSDNYLKTLAELTSAIRSLGTAQSASPALTELLLFAHVSPEDLPTLHDYVCRMLWIGLDPLPEDEQRVVDALGDFIEELTFNPYPADARGE